MQTPNSEPPDPKSYPPRVCRICLETVHPTFRSSDLPEFFGTRQVVYESGPELGRLLRPCKCKGSSRYVHEGCLQTWRHADPYSRRHFWQCPTCGFQYRLGRLTWSRWISSVGAQIVLTLAVLLLTVFLLGFVADPILNRYVDPLDITDYWEPIDSSWTEHFIKGLASLGVLSILKVLLGMPWSWLNIRTSGVGTSGRTGRSRIASVGWVMILIGVCSFLWVCRSPWLSDLTNSRQTVYKGVRAWSRRTLERAGEKVMDVPLPEDEDE